MHPASSVIIFTTLSGLGFGLLMWLGIGRPDVSGWSAFVFFAIAYALAVGGLLASTFHLGHPERAIKALSQWKTSWLSREGICAIAALIIMAIYGGGLVFFGVSYTLIGMIGSVLSLLVVFTTSMIYTQLKTVPRWNIWPTPLLFLSLSITGGAILAGQVHWALILLIISGVVQIMYWHIGDGAFAKRGSNLATATGLANHPDKLRAFEPPHTGTNYLMREMVHVIGRKHSQKLRIIAFLLAYVIPVVLLLLPFNHLIALIVVLSHMCGVAVSRWLFFAQAEHVVGIYYGKR